MAAGDRKLEISGIKAYTTSRSGARFVVLLFDSNNGDLLAVIEADRLGQMRTGAASAVATKYLAREDADTVGIFGTGWQAESQLLGVCAVRGIKTITAWGRNEQRRESFCRKMTAALGVQVSPAAAPEEAARGQSIIITATTARDPVLKGEWVEAGTHINAVGSNYLVRAEIDTETLGKASLIAVDSLDQARLESGDLVAAIERGALCWEAVTELGRIVARRAPGRSRASDITLFESHGIALWDIAAASKVCRLASERGVGKTIAFWSNQPPD
jgi:ornithine cyclodeaminase/alanine dehydrogenase-like protein (mu-crystallin family)